MAEQEQNKPPEKTAPESKPQTETKTATTTAPRSDSRGSSGVRGGGRDRQRGRGDRRRYFRRKKVDYFSVNKIDDVNYKDIHILKQFIGDRGKILPRRHTGLSAMHQRKLKIAIKRARNIALLPFAGESDGLRPPRPEVKS